MEQNTLPSLDSFLEDVYNTPKGYNPNNLFSVKLSVSRRKSVNFNFPPQLQFWLFLPFSLLRHRPVTTNIIVIPNQRTIGQEGKEETCFTKQEGKTSKYFTLKTSLRQHQGEFFYLVLF